MNKLVKQGFPGAGGMEKGAAGRARIGGATVTNGWVLAVLLVERWLATGARVDALLEQLTPDLPATERARAQQLFFGVVRWRGRIEGALLGLMAHAPRTKVRAVLLVAGFELLEAGGRPVIGYRLLEEGSRIGVGREEGKGTEQGVASSEDGNPRADRAGGVAKVVHHAVGQAKIVCSAKEAGLINAVARKMAGRLAAAPAGLAEEFSHPDWLVERWRRQFGDEVARRLLEWNQTPAPVFVRWRDEAVVPPAFLRPTRWAGFFEAQPGHGEELRRLAREGMLYVQDPSTRLAVELVAPQANETILDACAAPGGKSLFLADVMKTGRIVALDLPSESADDEARIRRLQENLNRAPKGVEIALMPADLGQASPRFFKEFNLPETYDAVLVDAPCSNTGVMRHRVDVKWRLQEGDFAQHARQQFALLKAAARMVAPSGRLVYSTCSVDAEENDLVVQRFLREVSGRSTGSGQGWVLERSVQVYPWSDGHDGAGVFLLRRKT